MTAVHERDEDATSSVRSRATTLRRPIVITALVLLFAGIAWLVARSNVSPETREFCGSYPEHATPNGVVREFALEAAPAEITTVLGRPLAVWAYNAQVPGPTLRVRLGETVRVTFTNRLPQPTTIHWHGVRVPNAMDGVPGVTQAPIQPGESFVYEFTPKDAGTFWFHPHLRSSEQIERGLFGVLIVEDAEPLPYSREVTWVLDDWLLTPGGEISPEFNTRHDLAHDGRWGNVVTVNGRRDERLVVRPGERLRLRLLNVANGRVFAPDLSQIPAKIVAIDGMYTARPLDPAGLVLAPGNRVDLDLTVPSDWHGQRRTVVDRFTPSPFSLVAIDTLDEEVETPRFPPPTAKHVPVWPGAAAAPLTADLHLNARAGGPFGIQWTINGEAFDHASHVAHPTVSLRFGIWSKIRFTNDSFRLHPMHIHGVFFKVVARNGVPVDEPYWRDTVLLRGKDTVDIGLVPLDRGRWMLHCHILEHAESGMMTLIDVS